MTEDIYKGHDLQKSRTLQDLSKVELIAKIKELQKRKKYGLVWDAKPEDVAEMCRTQLPVLKEVKNKEIVTGGAQNVNLLIEGDNYHALSVLNYTHKGKIDVIYIDPPYNTGAKDWKYNNDYVDDKDPWRHSKWVSMMHNRLSLAKRLLKENGALICAIDDYELNTLGLLLDELFPNYDKNIIIVEHHPQGAGSITISRTHEYAYILTPAGLGIDGREINTEDDRWSLKRSGQGENNWRENRPNQFFAILIDKKNGKVVGVESSIEKNKKKYPLGKTEEGYSRIYPLDKRGQERVWRYNPETMKKLIKEGLIEYTKAGALVVKKSGNVSAPIFSVWKGSRYNAGTNGSNLLTQILAKVNAFPYPKSLYTVLDMINLIVKNRKNATILDFFAGSGTTGHAVLELNKIDAGNRTFILCTNNENNIAVDVCYPRIENVIRGYKNNEGERVGGTESRLKYFKTAFVNAEPTDGNKKKLTREAIEMLCIKEATYDLVEETSDYKIFKNDKHYCGIILDSQVIQDFKKIIEKIKGKFNVYIFSLGDDTFDEEFEDFKGHVKVAPIPEAILKTYRRIFK